MVVTETRGKIELTAALKVSFCKSVTPPPPLFCAQNKQNRQTYGKMCDAIVGGGGRQRAPSERKGNNSLMANKDRKRRTSNRLLSRSLILLLFAIKDATINMAHTCVMNVLSFSLKLMRILNTHKKETDLSILSLDCYGRKFAARELN